MSNIFYDARNYFHHNFHQMVNPSLRMRGIIDIYGHSIKPHYDRSTERQLNQQGISHSNGLVRFVYKAIDDSILDLTNHE